MKKKIIIFFIISISIFTIYPIIITLLITLGSPQQPTTANQKLDFKELFIDYSKIPKFKQYTARDGAALYYRHYPSNAYYTLILLHGSSWHSRYFFPLANYLSKNNVAEIYTPDLRGHGHSPIRRGAVNYIGQIEDDLADLIASIKKENPGKKIILGGHSSGGGLTIRFAGSKYGKQISAYLLLAPYLKHDAPTTRPNSGEWAQPHISRIIGLAMLNNLGITRFNYLPIMKFNMPKEARDGTETLIYSFRLNASLTPRDYKKDLMAIERDQPLLLIAGGKDESFYADKFELIISQYNKNGEVKIMKGITHMGVVMSPGVGPVIQEWVKSHFKD